MSSVTLHIYTLVEDYHIITSKFVIPVWLETRPQRTLHRDTRVEDYTHNQNLWDLEIVTWVYRSIRGWLPHTWLLATAEPKWFKGDESHKYVDDLLPHVDYLLPQVLVYCMVMELAIRITEIYL